jgi:hypothetical protein
LETTICSKQTVQPASSTAEESAGCHRPAPATTPPNDDVSATIEDGPWRRLYLQARSHHRAVSFVGVALLGLLVGSSCALAYRLHRPVEVAKAVPVLDVGSVARVIRVASATPAIAPDVIPVVDLAALPRVPATSSLEPKRGGAARGGHQRMGHACDLLTALDGRDHTTRKRDCL